MIKWNEIPIPGKYALDVETDNLEYNRKLRLVQMSDDQNVYLIDQKDIWESMPWEQYEVVGHYFYFDFLTLRRNLKNFKYPKVDYDTYIVAMAMQREKKGLDDLVFEEFGHVMKKLEQVGFFTEAELTKEQIVYAVDDPVQTWNLANRFKKIYSSYDKIFKLEFELLPVLIEQTYIGMNVNQSAVINYDTVADTKIEQGEKELNELVGMTLKVNSPKQLANYIYGNLGFTPAVLTDKGNPSVNEEALEFIDHPHVDKIKEVKGLWSIKKGFKSLLPHIIDGKVHPEFLQIGYDQASSRIYCLSGDSEVDIQGIGICLKDLYILKDRYLDKRVKSDGGYYFINDVMKNGEKELFEIELDDGKKIKCTYDHLIAVDLNGVMVWKKAGKLTQNDDVIIE